MYIPCITGFVRSSHPRLLLLCSRKIANFHRYPTRSSEKRQMEQLQADMAAMKAQMEVQMTQFMEVVTNMNQGQQELRALVERTRSEDGRRNPFDDASVGQPRVEANNADLGINDHSRGPGVHLTVIPQNFPSYTSRHSIHP